MGGFITVGQFCQNQTFAQKGNFLANLNQIWHNYGVLNKKMIEIIFFAKKNFFRPKLGRFWPKKWFFDPKLSYISN